MEGLIFFIIYTMSIICQLCNVGWHFKTFILFLRGVSGRQKYVFKRKSRWQRCVQVWTLMPKSIHVSSASMVTFDTLYIYHSLGFSFYFCWTNALLLLYNVSFRTTCLSIGNCSTRGKCSPSPTWKSQWERGSARRTHTHRQILLWGIRPALYLGCYDTCFC